MSTNPYLMIRVSMGNGDTIAIVDPDGADRIVTQAKETL